MLISVVIPTCERNADLAACLDRLRRAAQLVPSGGIEVIVTDDGRTSTARDMIKSDFPWVRWLEGPRRGPAANRNHGAGEARGEWIIFVDDDCLPEPGFLRAYLDGIEPNDVNVLEGCTSATGIRTRLNMVCPVNEAGGSLWSCNMAIRRDLFLKVGGFDPNFPGPTLEDMDLHLRLKKTGETIRFLPKAKVLHAWRRRGGVAFLPIFAESYIYYLSKHAEYAGAISWRQLTISVPRKLFRQIPLLIWRYRIVSGLGDLVAEAFYAPFVIRRALRRSRKGTFPPS